MVAFPPKTRGRAGALSDAIRAVREKRGLTTTALARMMDMNRRSYERFESGRTPVRYDRLQQFAYVTDSDLLAIVTAAETGQTGIAATTVSNKVVRVQASSLKRFVDRIGDRLAELDPLTVLAAADSMFEELEAHLDKRRVLLSTILQPPPDDDERA